MRLAEKHLGAQLANAEVIWNPFNVDYDARPPWPPYGDSDELRLACVARLAPSAKGQDLLLEALATPAWSERRWRLDLYGEGDMRTTLQRLAERLGLSAKVSFAGHRAVREIWEANHVLVMPSRFEGMPLAMVEAMLCARPVVATDVAGHAELLDDGVTGFLAAAPTVAHMGEALERMWAARSRLAQIGEVGARRIRERVPRDPARIFAEKIEAHLEAVGRPAQRAWAAE